MKRKSKPCLNKKALDAYKEKLLNLRDDLIAQIKDISEDTLMKSQKEISGDISGYTLHIADMATDNYDRDFNIGLVSNERQILLQVDEALKRIEDKSYGVCMRCVKSIAKIRLNAIPYTELCHKCKEKLEKEK